MILTYMRSEKKQKAIKLESQKIKNIEGDGGKVATLVAAATLFTFRQN